MLKQQGAHLVDDGGAFDDDALADAMGGLQLELLGVLERYASHRAATAGFSDRFRVVVVVLVRLHVRLDELGGDDAHFMPGRSEAPTPVLRAGA